MRERPLLALARAPLASQCTALSNTAHRMIPASVGEMIDPPASHSPTGELNHLPTYTYASVNGGSYLGEYPSGKSFTYDHLR